MQRHEKQLILWFTQEYRKIIINEVIMSIRKLKTVDAAVSKLIEMRDHEEI